MRWLEIARERNPEAIEPRLLLANYAERDGDFDELLVLARESLTLQPYNDTVLAHLGEAQLERGEVAMALSTFREALRVAPDAVRNALNLARAELAAGNESAARALVVEAAHPDDNADELVAGVLVEDFRRGQPDRAQRLASAIQERYRRSPIGFEIAGDLHMLAGDFTAAAAAYDNALRFGDERRIAFKAFASARASGAATAIRPLQRWLQAHPDDARIARIMRAAGN